MARASSGSRSASSSIDPLRSANSTVTCLRSPSRAAREVRLCDEGRRTKDEGRPGSGPPSSLVARPGSALGAELRVLRTLLLAGWAAHTSDPVLLCLAVRGGRGRGGIAGAGRRRGGYGGRAGHLDDGAGTRVGDPQRAVG